MPHDKNGRPLSVGNTVLLLATLTAVSLGVEEQCNITAEVQGPDGEYKPVITGNSKLAELVAPYSDPVAQTKQHRKDLDAVLQRLKLDSIPTAPSGTRASRERALAVTKIQESIMWLGMDLKAQNEEGTPGTENPYPNSYNPASPVIEPTADGLKL